jgi:ribosomal protein S2
LLDQYYFKRLRLFKVPFNILLAYHSALGNTIKLWTSFYMLSHILAIRNNLHILNTASLIIQIRKALNALFSRIHSRGSLLIYAQAYKALKINHEAVFTFVTSWLPGLISNYKRMITMLSVNREVLSIYGKRFFKRPQLDALSATNFRPVLQVSSICFPKKTAHLAIIPSISLSVLDDFIWLNECHNLQIPSIQICDTQSSFDLVTYPIVANQRSVPFTYLIIHLFSETFNFAVMHEHLYFIYFYNFYNIIARFKKNLKRRQAKHTKHKFNFRKYLKKTDKFGKIISFGDDLLLQDKFKIQQALDKVSYLSLKKRKTLITNKRTFIINRKFFSFRIRDFIKNKIITKHPLTLPFVWWKFVPTALIIMLRILQRNLLHLNRKRKVLHYYEFKRKYRPQFKASLVLFGRLTKACLPYEMTKYVGFRRLQRRSLNKTDLSFASRMAFILAVRNFRLNHKLKRKFKRRFFLPVKRR